MKGTSVRYGVRFGGCRMGRYHDPVTLRDDDGKKVETCRICRTRRVWLKGKGGRIDSPEYLVFHVRSFAQRNGSTKRVFYKIYGQEKLTIKV